MAEHIIRFSKLENENVVKPKDKLDWHVKDDRNGKYELHGRRFISRTKKTFVHPINLPEYKWD
jgi:hypothetical protein